ncbi:MAG: hypothetical protein HC772_06315 [Leptolyngbyaceae cyanobacterium CRU_2_3]|nr:hypothetical protein [Leptolyngbyaceae cyanobacterium CRU_2_3]
MKFSATPVLNRLKQHKRIQLPLFNVEGDRCPLELSVELISGEKIPLQMELVKGGKGWAIDAWKRTG